MDLNTAHDDLLDFGSLDSFTWKRGDAAQAARDEFNAGKAHAAADAYASTINNGGTEAAAKLAARKAAARFTSRPR